jgi:hypothetical protein
MSSTGNKRIPEESWAKEKKTLEHHFNDIYTNTKVKKSRNALSNWFQIGMGKTK